MCHPHHDIRPVQRDCICLQRGDHGPHIAACNARFRAQFFSTVTGVRAALRAEYQLADSVALAVAATLN